jgi:polar amino acid transport system substrate-binding protein
MIRRLLALLLLLAGTLPATAAELRSGWYAGEPQQFVQRRDGRERLTGVDIEMVHAIATRAGHSVRFAPMAYPDLLRQVTRNEIELATGIADTAERRAAGQFSRAYRHDINVLIMRRGEAARLPAADAPALLRGLIADPAFRLGVRAGFSYVDPALDAFLATPEQAGRIRTAPDSATNLQRLLAGEIDGFLDERLSIALLIGQSGARPFVKEAPFRLAVPLHLMFAPGVPETTVQAFDRAIAALEEEGRLGAIAGRFRAPVLLAITLGSEWLFIFEVMGTGNSALAGYLAARLSQFSLFGALVLATINGSGGGVLRDLMLGRQPIGFMASPLKMFIILGTVAAAYAVGQIWNLLRGRLLLAFTLAQGFAWVRRRQLHNFTFEVVDAVALGLLTATGVAVTFGMAATPLWLWGSVMGTLTGAGAGIMRDVVRGGGVRNLRDGLYAEVALAWSLALSLYLGWRSPVIEEQEMVTVVIVTIIGVAATRMAVVIFGWRPLRLP